MYSATRLIKRHVRDRRIRKSYKRGLRAIRGYIDRFHESVAVYRYPIARSGRTLLKTVLDEHVDVCKLSTSGGLNWFPKSP